MPRKLRCWKWTTGGYGTSVTVYERVPGGNLHVRVPKPGGGWNCVGLGHADRAVAMQEAQALAARRQAGDGQPGPLTVAGMFALYLKSVGGKQTAVHSADTKRAAELWTRVLGPDYKVQRIGPSDFESFERLRGSGELNARGHTITDPDKREPVGPRIIAKDLKLLRAACRRATIERTSAGAFLLATDPTRGLALPVERNPHRPIYDNDRVDLLLRFAPRVQFRIGWGQDARWEPSPLPMLLRLAADTGRRVRAILALRASDWRPDLGTHGQIRWQAVSDKVKKEWWAPVTPEVRSELEQYRRDRLLVGDALFFPSPNDPAKPVSVQLAIDLLRRAEKLAGLEPLPRGAWHPFRRKWATERKHLSPKDVAAVGGWVDTTTLQKVYQAADAETMEAVVLQPKRLRKLG